MLDRRWARPVAAAAAALALAVPCLPAHADPSNPTPSELKRAQEQVDAAKRSVQSSAVQAEQAAEAYNGALVRAEAAQRVSDRASARAAVADAAQARAQGVAAGARAAADASVASARAATVARQAAEHRVTAAQQQLDGMAASAYKTGGQSGVMTSLLHTTDPNDLQRGRAYADRVGTYQRDVVDELGQARNAATTAAQVAAAASAAAAVSARAAGSALDKAAQAQAVAASARDSASDAAGAAQHALYLASRAKAHALYLVSRAEVHLGDAKQRARALEVAAAEARRAAAAFSPGRATSEAARVAMEWALKEVGVPYSWGGGDADGPTYGFAQGAGTKGFDCSGLTLFAYAHAGIALDHYSVSQYGQGMRVSSRADLQPGDLMFFAYDPSDSGTIHHVSMYLGNGTMIEAPHTGAVVRVTSADRGDYIGATRPWA